jgi:hypothetical protein
MSRARHRKEGGRTGMWVSGNPDVEKEAEGKEEYAKGDEKKKGGMVKKKKRATGGVVEGSAPKMRLDRPGRKRGGGVGSNRSPLSTAHSGKAGGNETPKSDDSYGGTPSD